MGLHGVNLGGGAVWRSGKLVSLHMEVGSSHTIVHKGPHIVSLSHHFGSDSRSHAGRQGWWHGELTRHPKRPTMMRQAPQQLSQRLSRLSASIQGALLSYRLQREVKPAGANRGRETVSAKRPRNADEGFGGTIVWDSWGTSCSSRALVLAASKCPPGCVLSHSVSRKTRPACRCTAVGLRLWLSEVMSDPIHRSRP